LIFSNSYGILFACTFSCSCSTFMFLGSCGSSSTFGGSFHSRFMFSYSYVGLTFLGGNSSSGAFASLSGNSGSSAFRCSRSRFSFLSSDGGSGAFVFGCGCGGFSSFGGCGGEFVLVFGSRFGGGFAFVSGFVLALSGCGAFAFAGTFAFVGTFASVFVFAKPGVCAFVAAGGAITGAAAHPKNN
jgi:hypothetical protein